MHVPIVLPNLNIALVRMSKLCRTLKMACTYKRCLFTKIFLMSFWCFIIWTIDLILEAGTLNSTQYLEVSIVKQCLMTCQTLVKLTCRPIQFMRGTIKIFRGGPSLTTCFLVDEGRDDSNTTISGSSSSRHRNAGGPMVTQH